LATVETLCVSAGERRTISRRGAYGFLVKSLPPIESYELITALGPIQRSATPRTVYRALDFQGAFDLVRRAVTPSPFVACKGPAGAHQAEFLRCDC
jgi:Fur family zinc uptake transcriptional regulator